MTYTIYDTADQRRFRVRGRSMRECVEKLDARGSDSLDGISIPKANLANVRLLWGMKNACLSGADLTRCEFPTGGNLLRCDLRCAKLNQAYLKFVDLSHSDLGWASLAMADLRNANFHGANMAGCCLAGARIAEAQFLGSRGLSWEALRLAQLWEIENAFRTIVGSKLLQMRPRGLEVMIDRLQSGWATIDSPYDLNHEMSIAGVAVGFHDWPVVFRGSAWTLASAFCGAIDRGCTPENDGVAFAILTWLTKL